MTVDLAAQFLDPLLGSFHGTPWEVARDGYLTSLPAFSLAPRGFASAVGGRPATCSPVPGQPSPRPRPATTSNRPGGGRRAVPTAGRGCPPRRPFPPASAPARRPAPSERRRGWRAEGADRADCAARRDWTASIGSKSEIPNPKSEKEEKGLGFRI